MFNFGSNTGPQPSPPLLDGLINDALFQLRPGADEVLLQVIELFEAIFSKPYSGTL